MMNALRPALHLCATVISCAVTCALLGAGTADAAAPKAKQPVQAAPAAALSAKERAAAEKLVRMEVLRSVQEVRSARAVQILLHAAYGRDLPVIRLLLEAGVPVNEKGKGDITALMFVCNAPAAPLPVDGFKHPQADCRPACVQLLLDAGADVHARDEEGKTALHHSPSAEITRMLLAAGADVHVADKSGTTPLMLAPTAEMASLLISAGAEVDARDAEGCTASMRTRNLQKLQLLLAAGADVNAKDAAGCTVMGHVVESCKSGIFALPHLLRLLAESGANRDSLSDALRRYCRLKYLLFRSYQTLSPESLVLEKHLLSCGADPTARDAEGKSALDYAQVVEKLGDLLIACEKDKRKLSDKRYLSWAESRSRNEYSDEKETRLRSMAARLKLLQDAAAGRVPSRAPISDLTVNEILKPSQASALAALKAMWLIYDEHDRNTSWGDGILWQALEDGDAAVLRLLLASGLSPEKDVMMKGTLLRIACSKGNADCVQVLLSYQADVNKKSSDRTSPSRGAGLLTVNMDEMTPLMWACNAGSEECVRLLLAAGAEADARNAKNYTALMWAADLGSEGCVRLLLDAGADVNVTSEDGYTALMWATHAPKPTCAELLLKAGANVNASAIGYLTPLMEACAVGNREMVKVLLAAGANVNAGNIRGATALMEAGEHSFRYMYGSVQPLLIRKDSADLVRQLLKAGADPNAQTWQLSLETPLLCACKSGSKESVRLLLEAGANPKKHAKELLKACHDTCSNRYYGKDGAGCEALLRAAGVK